jgi:hypothetical protein
VSSSYLVFKVLFKPNASSLSERRLPSEPDLR